MGNSLLLQVRVECISLWRAESVLVEDMIPVGGDGRYRHRCAGEHCVVAGGGGTARSVVFVEMAKLDPQDCRLKRIEPAVHPQDLVIIADAGTVRRNHAHPVGESGIVGDDHPSVAEASETLAREEADTPCSAETAELSSFVRCPHRLGSILDHRDAMFFPDSKDRIHVRRLSVEMNGDDRLCPGCDRRLDPGGIDVEGGGIDIDIDRLCPQDADRLRGRHKRERRRNHLISRTDAECHHGDLQGIRS